MYMLSSYCNSSAKCRACTVNQWPYWLETRHTLTKHKMTRRYTERLQNVLCTLNLRLRHRRGDGGTRWFNFWVVISHSLESPLTGKDIFVKICSFTKIFKIYLYEIQFTVTLVFIELDILRTENFNFVKKVSNFICSKKYRKRLENWILFKRACRDK